MHAPLSTPALRRRLLRWYDAHRRPLPWREPQHAADPYAIWVSEIMLQQTRVATVIPYYRAWMRRFPDVNSLARARRATVLARWSGLGYYRRAVHLHTAARLLARHHGGRVPRARAPLLALPGVGDYTAAAILSIAYGEPYAAIDGNVARIVGRHAGLAGPSPLIATLAGTWLDHRRPGDFNQALMDLGATTCLPRAPLCPSCPIAAGCQSLGRAPRTAGRRPARRVREHFALYRQGGRVWLRQRPAAAPLMPGLWELPTAPAPRGRRLGILRHSITTRRIEAILHAADGVPAGTGAWVSERTARNRPLTGLTRKFLREYAGWTL